MEIYHVLPENDAKEHSEYCMNIGNMLQCGCLCRPKHEKQSNGNIIVIHNSFDGRENFEPDNKVRSN